MSKRKVTGRLRGRSGASGGAFALGLRSLFACRRFLGSGIRLWLSARKDFDVTEAGHNELDGVARLATLIFPGAGTDLAYEAQAGADLHSLLDQGNLCRRKDDDAM